MKFLRKIGYLIALLPIILCFLGCEKAEQVKKLEEELKVIRIGVILPLSGDGAAYGKKEQDGVSLAIEEANAELRKQNRKIEVIYEDSQGIPAPAVSAINKLIMEKVQAVIGDAFSSPTLAMVPIADKNKCVVISPSASSPKLSGSSLYFFRVWPSDTSEGDVMAEVAVKSLGLQKLAVLHGNNEYGLGLRDVFSKKIKELGKEVAIVEVYNEGDTDFRSQLTKVKEKSPDGIYLAGYYKEFAKILKQARELGIKVQFLSCGTFHEPEILNIAGNAAEGVVFVQPYFDRDSNDSVTQNFVKNYEKKFNIEAGVYAAHAYDAARVICEVIKAGNTTSEDIRMGLLKLKDFPGVTGKTTFIKGGDVIKPVRIMQVQDGKFLNYR